MYSDRNATMSGAQRRGSAGMDRRPNAAWVSLPVVWPGWIAGRTPRGFHHRLFGQAGPRAFGGGGDRHGPHLLRVPSIWGLAEETRILARRAGPRDFLKRGLRGTQTPGRRPRDGRGHTRVGDTRSRCACGPRCRRLPGKLVGVPVPARHLPLAAVRRPRDRGECLKGGTPPCHKMTTTNRNSPPCAYSAQGSFDSRARSGWESGPPTSAPPAPGSPCGSRRTSEGRREAPGGSEGGPASIRLRDQPSNRPSAPLPERSTTSRCAKMKGP